MEEYAKEQVLKKEDGTTAYILDGKLHSWEHASLVFPKALKQKDEYYIYGIHYTKEQWEEMRKNREGLPFFKQSSMKVRT